MNVFCTECGARLLEGASFCCRCGHAVVLLSERASNNYAVVKCSKCGKENSDNAINCICCGRPIAEIIEKQEATPVISIDDKNRQEIENFNLLGDDMRADKKYLAALDYYIKAANLGSAHAQLWIGNIYDQGLGVEANPKEAAKWFHMAAEQDDISALNNLAVMYENGTGVEQNYNLAVELYMRAIANGSVTAAGNLGSLYNNGPEGVQSYHLAIKYYERAISEGTTNSTVYNNLALIYANGTGTSADYIKAEKYYLKAIELGNKTARANYGVFANNRGVAYTDGKGVEKNYTKAEAYYQKAIEMGNAKAKENYAVLLNNLGVMYADGTGVEKNHAKAVSYYLKAIEYGNPKAKSNYDALKKSMTTPQAKTPSPSKQTSRGNGAFFGIVVAIILILVCMFIGTASDNSDKINTRTCAWCNGTGYSGNGALTPEEYVFKKTPCTHCGGDGKY